MNKYKYICIGAIGVSIGIGGGMIGGESGTLAITFGMIFLCCLALIFFIVGNE